MAFFNSPASFRERNPLASFNAADASADLGLFQQSWATSPIMNMNGNQPLPPHSSHPSLPHLAMLIFEAVLEVVCVSLPGYIIARQGLFTAEMQKFTANLNVALFTPCLVFTKLASQLSADKLGDLAIIPAIFIAQTLISFLCALAISKAFGFSRRPRNFVIAMGVFGNSNSLPISLVLSLSKTIKGLHWSKVPNDNDEEVAARGILYLLIFQQLGQLVRWSWGYNVLLASPDETQGTTENQNARLESGSEEENRQLMRDYTDEDASDEQNLSGSDETRVEDADPKLSYEDRQANFDVPPIPSGEQTPITFQPVTSSASSSKSSKRKPSVPQPPEILPTPTNGNVKPPRRALTRSPEIPSSSDQEPVPSGLKGYPVRCRLAIKNFFQRAGKSVSDVFSKLFGMLPPALQQALTNTYLALKRFCLGVWAFMNPPLWAMLIAILVASIPDLQKLFFTDGTFIKNSVTGAIEANAGVAVPLILVVLGGNLAGNTLPQDPQSNAEKKEESKILIAAILSRMVLPFAIIAPLLAVVAKYVPVSILDDPIFVIVCFLITGAPSALQLAQICQINNVYMGAMSRLLFQSYVIWILPSTLILVMTALEVVEWAKR